MTGPATREATAPTPARMRRAMGHFASGVTVVTGRDAEGPVGFACQSFASVSLEPPLVLFCADHRGRAWPRIRAGGSFCINVLGADQVALCNRFGSSRGEKFAGLGWSSSPWGDPCLPDVLMRAHATVETVHVAGDHDVVIGRVRAVEELRADEPLVFYRGRFGVVGDATYALPDLYGWNDHWA